MSSAEYYLIPKATFKNLVSETQDHSIERPIPKSKFVMDIPPPEKKSNPNIKDLLSFYIDHPAKLRVAENLLEYFKNHERISFDERGNLFAPINDGNILDVIQYLVLNKSSNHANKDFIKNLINIINIPKNYVTNKASRKFLFEEVRKINPPQSRIPILATPPQDSINQINNMMRSQSVETLSNIVPSRLRTRARPIHYKPYTRS